MPCAPTVWFNYLKNVVVGGTHQHPGGRFVIDGEILETLEKMPEPFKTELLHYAKYLIENYSKDVSQMQPPQNKRRAGILKGTFVLPLPDDFDEPLADFKEYME